MSSTNFTWSILENIDPFVLTDIWMMHLMNLFQYVDYGWNTVIYWQSVLQEKEVGIYQSILKTSSTQANNYWVSVSSELNFCDKLTQLFCLQWPNNSETCDNSKNKHLNWNFEQMQGEKQTRNSILRRKKIN